MKTKQKNSQDRVFYLVSYFISVVLVLIVLYPIIYVLSSSVSDADAVAQGKVWLVPVNFTLDAYKRVLAYNKVWTGYGNTIIYTVSGTLINLAITLMCAYPLARKNLRWRGTIMLIFSFTMMFGGGIIPNYILIRELGMLNTRWSIIIPGAMSVYNMIVCRTFIETNIAEEMQEACQIDGCDDFQFFFKMVLPLSKAIIAVLALWYAVDHWNSYFNAFLYLKDSDKYPLQIILREILIQSEGMKGSDDTLAEDMANSQNLYLTLKYAVIVVSTLPLFCVYPFVQKYFQEGVMVGSVKG
ncbi:MAG: carbohydrate ABC transporter permease [Lachnospiraceae bacterium]|nr:carbohydrate ABC transporter permease [Lachnospiraceae bacterium]